MRASGREGAAQLYDTWHEAFPDNRVEPTLTLVEGMNGMHESHFRGTRTGTMRGPSGDMPATGRRVDLPFTALLAVEGDELTSFRVSFDLLDMLDSSVSRTGQRRLGERSRHAGRHDVPLPGRSLLERAPVLAGLGGACRGLTARTTVPAQARRNGRSERGRHLTAPALRRALAHGPSTGDLSHRTRGRLRSRPRGDRARRHPCAHLRSPVRRLQSGPAPDRLPTVSSEPHATETVREHRTLANPRRLRLASGRLAAPRDQRPQDGARPDARPA